ncbi:MAG: MiaB/RimO family radical SAM methylthiotransferase, partial [Parachlamydiales bacterium]
KALKEKNKKAKFYITGCIGKEVIDLIGSDVIIIPNNQKNDLVATIFPERIVPKFYIKNFDGHTRAFVKIQDGCNSCCSYCVIPFTRGRSRSRSKDEIIFEITKLVDNGYQEIVLTGINIGEYNTEMSFEKLLNEIEKIEGLNRIKISSIDSKHITDDLINILTSSEKMVSSLHLVLQSGSEKILRKMNRKYTPEFFLEKVEKIISRNPDFTFTTDVIVGFPSETAEDLERTIDILNKVGFTKVHIFPYSKRPNTLAATFEEQIDEKIIHERKKVLEDSALRIAFKKREQFIGREMDVLFEQPSDNMSFGSTKNNLFIGVRDKIPANSVLKVKLKENKKEYILGELCK